MNKYKNTFFLNLIFLGFFLLLTGFGVSIIAGGLSKPIEFASASEPQLQFTSPTNGQVIQGGEPIMITGYIGNEPRGYSFNVYVNSNIAC